MKILFRSNSNPIQVLFKSYSNPIQILFNSISYSTHTRNLFQPLFNPYSNPNRIRPPTPHSWEGVRIRLGQLQWKGRGTHCREGKGNSADRGGGKQKGEGGGGAEETLRGAHCLDSVARRAAPRRGLSGAITKSELHSPEEQRDLVIVRSDPKAREVTKNLVFLVNP